MWNKKKEDEFPPRPAAAPAHAPAQAHAPAPAASAPALSARPADSHEGPRSSAMIGKSVMIKGEIHSHEDLTIDGEVEGTVELREHRLTVGPNGRVQASVKAREIVVLGTILGNVDVTDKIDIRKDAKLVGDIRTARIVIEDGAYFKGSTDIVRPDAKPQPAAKSAAVPAPAHAPAAAAHVPATVAAAEVKS